MNNTFDHCCVLNPNVQGCEPTDECQNSSGCFLKGGELIERTQNYAFEGEKIEWEVLVMDKNKIEDIRDVIITIGAQTGEGESGCFGTPREGVCENYDYEQCLDVDGCEPLCDIFVAGNGECDGDPCFTSIQTAINNSLSGDVICVESGTYEEDLTIPTGLVNLELVSVAPVIIKGESNVPAAKERLIASRKSLIAGSRPPACPTPRDIILSRMKKSFKVTSRVTSTPNIPVNLEPGSIVFTSSAMLFLTQIRSKMLSFRASSWATMAEK